MSDEKKPNGRPPYAPTDHDRGQVKALAAMGATMFEISQVMQVSEPTLRKYFPLELATGAIEANAKVARSLFKQATDPDKPNVTAAIFWLKARAGWRDGRESSAGDEETPGKKVLAQQEAKTAAAGTEWESILPSADRMQ
ncbi:MAG TPA: hypothetical protein VLH12_08830 [Usitatibacter sp.]|nr:hypothetical protein [Usitatibacter sp.]